jgi:solute carrier family 25 phosphate transporter 3
MQTSIKYSFYEVFKDLYGKMVIDDHADTNSMMMKFVPQTTKGLVYVTAAASAELIADIFMCPFEMCRVQMQTNPHFPQRIVPGLRHLYRHRAKYGFPFGSLIPIWMRQVPGTIANFYTFETVVGIIDDHGLGIPKESCDTRIQLAVTVVSGYVAGIFCAMVSHPADSLLSWKAIHPQKTISELVQMIGLRRLATQGLATRMFITSQVIGMQWLLYDSFRIALGCGTTGSGH